MSDDTRWEKDDREILRRLEEEGEHFDAYTPDEYVPDTDEYDVDGREREVDEDEQ